MAIKEKIREFFERNREKHKLTFIHDSDYKEKWSFRVSMLNLWTLLAFYTILIGLLLIILLKFTPLKYVITDQIENASTETILDNSARIDSLVSITESRQHYLDDLLRILNDQPFNDSLYSSVSDSSFEMYIPQFEKSSEDSLLRYKIEKGEKDSEDQKDLNFFLAPVTGTISKSFNARQGHFGIDIVTTRDEVIKACLSGTVVISGWTVNEGHVIVVQHTENMISVYKHCSVLMKKQGELVQEGDPIAIVGNTGENTSGYHLHFELWQGGYPLNPQEFISFE